MTHTVSSTQLTTKHSVKVALSNYCRWRLLYVTAFHSAAMVVIVPFFLFLFVVSDKVGVDKDRVELVVGFVFAISTLSSFPVAALTICARGVRVKRHYWRHGNTPRDNEAIHHKS
jgi:Kef-type K+ transport system membrane component KefB